MILENTGEFSYIELHTTDEKDMLELYLKHISLGKKRGYFPVFFERNNQLSTVFAAEYGLLDDLTYLFYKNERRYICPALPGTSSNACEYGSCSAAPPASYRNEDVKKHYALLRQAILKKANEHDYPYWKKKIFEIYYSDGDTSPESIQENLASLNPPPDTFYKSLPKTDSWKTGRERYIADWEEFSMALIPAEHSYELFAWFPIGGFNWNPFPEYHAAFSRHLYEAYGALPMTIHREYVEYYVPEPLYDIKSVREASQDMLIMDFDTYEDIESEARLIYGKHIWTMWWD